MQFQTSRYSHLTEANYGEAATNYVDVKDVPGDVFRVYSDGVIEWLKTGKTWAPTLNIGTYNQIIANLADVPGNEAKMASVLGETKVATAITEAPGYTPSLPSTGGQPGAADIKVPLTQRIWFWPTVLVGATALIGGGVYYFKFRQS